MARPVLLLSPLALLIAAICLLAAAPRSASAHAILLQSDPPVNAQLQSPPGIVTTFYSEALDQRLSSLEVVDGTGERVDNGELTFGPEAERMAIAIDGNLEPGFYTVIWETLSSVDGHLLKGSFPFTVLNEDGSQPSGPRFDAGGTSGSTADIQTVTVKWAGIIAATLLVGALAFFAWVNGPAARDAAAPWAERSREYIHRRSMIVAAIAAVALVFVAIGEFLLQIDQLGGFEWTDEVLSNEWGERWIQRQIVLAGIGIALIAGAFFWRAGRRGAAEAAVWVALIGGIAYLLLVAMVSHGQAVPGSFWAVGNDFLHLVSTSVWVGMLVMLAFFVLWLRREVPEDARDDLQVGHLQRFSAIAATSVVVLLATGTINGLTHIPDIESLFDTAYGRSLLIKLGVIALLLPVAAINAFYLRPRILEEGEEGRPASRLLTALSRVIWVEIGVAIAVIFFASILIQYPTARQVDEAEANVQEGTTAVVGYEEIQPAGDIQINLTISPNSVGQNSFRVFLFPQADTDIGEVLRVRLRFAPPEADVGESQIEMEPAGLNAYRAVGPFFSSEGNWDVHVDVRRAEVDDVSAAFPVSVPGPASRDQFAFPLAVGSWLTVAAIVLLVIALIAGIWITEWPRLPDFAPRFLRISVAALSVVGVGLLALSLVPEESAAGGNPIESTPESIAIGRSLYMQNCVQCHGENGDGNGSIADTLPVKPVDFRQHLPYHQDEFFFRVISNGLGTIMPAFGEQLTEDEIWHLLNFLQSEFGAVAETPATTP